MLIYLTHHSLSFPLAGPPQADFFTIPNKSEGFWTSQNDRIDTSQLASCHCERSEAIPEIATGFALAMTFQVGLPRTLRVLAMTM
jgi:hypothetical protein